MPHLADKRPIRHISTSPNLGGGIARVEIHLSTVHKLFKTDEPSLAKVRVIFPMYGDPNDTTHTSGGDRPLRHELRGRVDRYRERYDPQEVAEARKHFTPFNAFVRSEMRNGRL